MSPDPSLADRLEGVLLGTAVGDALGLPFEGMCRKRVHRVLGDSPLEHHFLAGRGMVSDDTDHACMVAQALAEVQGDPKAFARALAWKLRWWLIGLPAGIGMGTLRGILKLWRGYGPELSGVLSAGNGPAMRAPILGVYARRDVARLAALIRTSTRITHTDPRAEQGALAVAHAAAIASTGDEERPRELLACVRASMGACEVSDLLDLAIEWADSPSEAFADELGLGRGVSGFVNHTVPIALHCWARHPADLRSALTEIIRLGGDTDTTGAIVGGLVGARTGTAGVPRAWLDGLVAWPRSVPWMRALAQSLAEAKRPPRYFWPAIVARNALFTTGVYLLLLRRVLPPY